MPLSANYYSAPLDIPVDNHVRISGHLYEVDMTRPEAISCKIVGGNIFERFIDYIYQRGWMKRPEEFIAQLHEFVASNESVKSDIHHACDFFTGITGEMNGLQSSGEMLDDSNVRMGCKLVKPTACFNQVLGRLISHLGNPDIPHAISCRSDAIRELNSSKIATSNYLTAVGKIHSLQERRNNILHCSISNNMTNKGAHIYITSMTDESNMPAIYRESPEDLESPQNITDRLWSGNDTSFDFVKAETTSVDFYSNELDAGELDKISCNIIGSPGSRMCLALNALTIPRDNDLKDELIKSSFSLKNAVLDLEKNVQDINESHREHIELIERTIKTVEARNSGLAAVDKIIDCTNKISTWIYGSGGNERNIPRSTITSIAEITNRKLQNQRIPTNLTQSTIENIVMVTRCNNVLMKMIFDADDNGTFNDDIELFNMYDTQYQNSWKHRMSKELIGEYVRGQEAVNQACNLNAKVDYLIQYADERMKMGFRMATSKSTQLVPSPADINRTQREINLNLTLQNIIRNM